ncbi:replication factor C subunit 2, putative [Babesia caballi]|uniref:Replication factor C subunit 2, putative n=1 Tax=Babesia caballi TaxID=5871 RepID=A0AAV4LPN3_BABCB|nr:replication factor C subunit 2, putative [Babesia caballi]
MKRNIPWVEKYRPAKLADVVFQTHAVATMQQIVETYNVSGTRTCTDYRSDASHDLSRPPRHREDLGRPGDGQTDLWVGSSAPPSPRHSAEAMKERVLELNASDERGINVVRDRIKTYTRLNISSNRVNPETGRVMPNFKIVILDEADMITPDAQAALRRIIENFSNISRFILICNYLHKIIGPIYSRCSAFHFKPIAQEAQVERLRFICRAEELECEDEALSFLTKVSQGDMRRSVTILQVRPAARARHMASQSTASLFDRVTEDAVRSVSGYPPRRIVDDIFAACMASNSEVRAEPAVSNASRSRPSAGRSSARGGKSPRSSNRCAPKLRSAIFADRRVRRQLRNAQRRGEGQYHH